MKLFTFLIALSTVSITFSQRHILNVSQDANSSYHEDKFQESIFHYDTMYRMSPQMFNMLFTIQIYAVHSKDQKAINFIEQYAKTNVKSAEFIKPISEYLTIRSIVDKNQLKQKAIEIQNHIINDRDTHYLSSMYYTGIYFQMVSNEILTIEQKKIWVKGLQSMNQNISEFQFQTVHDLKGYIDFVLSYELFKMGETNSQKIINHLCTLESVSALNEFRLLGHQKGFLSYWEVKKELIENNLKSNPSDTNSLKRAVDLVVCYPTKKNMNWLKKQYQLKSELFNEFWYRNFENSFQSFSSNDKIDRYIDSLSSANDWLIIDIWGTWCYPCVLELPKLADFGKKMEKHPEKHIKFLTMSCAPQKLDEFMKSNKYSFPVLVVNGEEMRSINVNSYPTTFLISPERKCIRIPYGINKVELIKILMQI